MRRAECELETFDDRMLRDIGIGPSEIRWVVGNGRELLDGRVPARTLGKAKTRVPPRRHRRDHAALEYAPPAADCTQGDLRPFCCLHSDDARAWHCARRQQASAEVRCDGLHATTLTPCPQPILQAKVRKHRT
jgi:hypothetical protein